MTFNEMKESYNTHKFKILVALLIGFMLGGLAEYYFVENVRLHDAKILNAIVIDNKGYTLHEVDTTK